MDDCEAIAGVRDLTLQGGDPDLNEGSRWEKATIAFTLLKAKIATTPILKHFDPNQLRVIVVYASKWIVSASMLQEYDGVYWPVTFTSRTLKPMRLILAWWRKRC